MSPPVLTIKVPTPSSYAISLRVLLGLYAIIPLCLLLQMLDQTLWHGALQAALPNSFKQLLLFQILFGTPHILASNIILASNPEYLQFFKTKLLRMSICIVLVFGLGSLFIPYKVLYCATALWTVHHVLKQQHGIARGVCRLPNRAFNVLVLFSVGAGFAIYLGIFLKNSLSLLATTWLQTTAAILCFALLAATLWSQRFVTTVFGKLFLWANTLLVLSSFWLYVSHYYLLAILIPRVVHDVTAFSVYITHDYNRQQQLADNKLYRWAQRCHIPVCVVLPTLAFTLAFVLQRYGDALIHDLTLVVFKVAVPKAITLGLIGYLSLMHYYAESFTWQQDSPYRRFIRFKL